MVRQWVLLHCGRFTQTPCYSRDCAAWRNLLTILFVSVQSPQKASNTDVPVHQSGKDAHKRQALELHCHQPLLLLHIKQRSRYYHLWKFPKVSLSFFLHGWIDMFRIAHNGCAGEPNDYHYPTVRISFTLINTSFSFPPLQCWGLRVCFHDLSHLPIICTILTQIVGLFMTSLSYWSSHYCSECLFLWCEILHCCKKLRLFALNSCFFGIKKKKKKKNPQLSAGVCT
jgi:hypothetical protein